MGVGYEASALHLISTLVVDESAPYTTEPPAWWGLPPIPGAKYMSGPPRFRSPAASEIVRWRNRLALRYRAQLGERLTWDEQSEFSLGEDAAVSADVMLRYVAAIVDEHGPEGLRSLVGAEKPAHEEIARALDAVDRRGFTGRFPQLSLTEYYWLPFQRNLIIEAPDWRGKTKRFGSVYRLADEVSDIRALLLHADPGCAPWTAEREVPARILWAAWQASETVAKVCAAGAARHLPVWTTG
jgi:hypothetical protein